ncbi:protocadherin Fat 3-like [Megalops cyprinoides]|uniref:protocadherin Fat 3-like n=1 Tax=Megalops cyprinoides TaxID=118141 RepID=UPI0018647327|nr:protocadherin Fat 3-like [Megalops cyprinoides]
MDMGHCKGEHTCLLCLALLLFLPLTEVCCQSPQEPGVASFFFFTQSVYNATIYENSAARTYLNSEVRMGITLAVRSWEIKYWIDSGDEEGLFIAEEYVLGDFCFLRIRTRGGNSAILNREIQDRYLLTVKATAKGGLEASSKVTVQVLDMNDLRPLFSPTAYSVTISESTPLGTNVAQVTATDADIGSNGEFYYLFRETVEMFAIHPTNGIIFLSGKLNVDKQKRYDLEVLAIDRGMKPYGNNDVSSMAKLSIRVERINEYTPTLSVITTVPSLQDKNPVYAVVTVEDQDEGLNGDIEWVSIVAGDPLEQFVVDRSAVGNEYKIKASEPVDWDSFPYGCNLTIQAKDRGSPPKFSDLQVVQLLIKRPQPIEVKFEKDVYQATFREISPPGSIVVTVSLFPKPLRSKYTLSPSADSEFFKINPQTGVITTAQPFTMVKQEVFELKVVEVNSRLNTKVLITIEDANDNTPRFSQPSYNVSISENIPIGTSILTVAAVDDDTGENGFITHSIASPQSLPFMVDPFTGVLRTTKELDFESSPEIYTFFVRGSDWGSPYRRESEVNVTVGLLNVNDNKPVFEKVACRGVISRDFPVGQMIITMSAIDVDEQDPIKFKLLSGNEQDFFNLNPDSGVLSLRRSLATANPKNGVFSLKITATDGEYFAVPTFVNMSVVRGRTAYKSLNCRETRVAQKIAEKRLKKANGGRKPTVDEGNTDIFSVNRQTPQFEAFPSDISVREDLKIGASVIKVKAYDGDTGFNGQIMYAISDGNQDSCFNIDMESGLITVFLPLDREKTDRYRLNVTIYDLGQPQKSSWRLVNVNVEDANDNEPKFLQDSYSTTIPEDTVIGTEVTKVQATDADLGRNGEIYYTMLTSTTPFGIHSSTGIVYVAGQLDRELISAFSLRIEARDKAEIGSQKFSVTTLTVSLEDVNDCPPAFIPNYYNTRIPEDLPVGTIITWLDSQDPDLGTGGQVRYTLVNSFTGMFEVHRESGAVRLAKELDYEERQFYNLTVQATDNGRPVSLSSVSFVEVEVVDVNENLYAPYFSDFALKGSVKENSRVGTSVLKVIAKDNDQGKDGEIRYSIRDGSGMGRFSIDEETGIIYTTDTLDRETKDSYWLTVRASDRGVVPLYSTIEIYIRVEDVNDNAPLTSDPIYHPTVMENSPKDVSVIQIQAQDLDGTTSAERLSYRISSGNPQNFFAMNHKTGLITTTSRKLDREQQAEHFLEVTFMDMGQASRQSTIWVIVHVLDENDNSPQFPEKFYQISLPERDRNKRGDPVYRMFAYDLDEGPNANLTYSIVDGNEDNKFVIDPLTAVVSSRKKVTAGSFDLLSIKATDNGSPQKWATAQLHIKWIRKPVPSLPPLLFSEPYYNFNITEDSKVAKIVGVVSTQQRDTPLWFDITGDGPSLEMFYVDQRSCVRDCSTAEKFGSPFDNTKGVGTIVIAKPLDAELQSFYNITVEVTDGTNTASTQVFITVLDSNDNPPVFSQPAYEVTVSEDTPADTEVLRVQATDRDKRSRLSYSLHSSVDPASIRMFRISPGTGAVYTADRLDHEACSQHILTVMVKDQEFPYHRDLARILVSVQDANDQAPYFTSVFYEGLVYDSAEVGSLVLQVTALDGDKGKNSQLLYSIEAGNTGNIFCIDPASGIISIVRELDLISIGRYVLSVRVTDGGFPPMSTTTTVHIAVTLSDNSSPKFLQREYQAEVNENVAVGTLVTTISAVSRFTLIYDIKQGNTDRTFKINPYTGVITTQRPLDYESTDSYVLTIQATNMAGMASSTTVSIQVVDKNDNFPIFQQLQYTGSISEAAPINSVVLSTDGRPLVIKATDADRNGNALLVYQIMEDTAKMFFSVDSGTGSIRTIANLDFETISSFNFRVHVRDSGVPQLTAESPAQVTIQVVDINDSPPRFSQDVYEAVLLLPTYIDVEALKVSAIDPDQNIPTQLTYSLTDTNMQHFAIEPSNGILTVKNSNFSKDRYRFSLTVSDGRFSSTALVTVLVREAIESGLSFTQNVYSTSVQENITNVTTLAVVTASGSRLNEPLKYSLLNAGTKFKIRTTSGVIQTTGVPFDREEQELYELVVEVSREYDRLRVARAMVRVQVDDINDNAPEFTGLPYFAVVQVDAEPGSSIFRVMASDQDKGKNGEVSYYLKEEHRHFNINRLTGELTLKKTFEVDLSNVEHQVIVFAKDGGYPPLLTAVEFPITVVNRAMPIFDKPFYGVSVSENVALLTPILGVKATSPEGENMIYTIVDGDPSSQFNIGFNTGIISVVYPLDFEVTSSYKLTVRATDMLTGARAEVGVDVTVLDVNDNPPVFQRALYGTVLAETSIIGTPVLQVMATDRDSGKNNLIRYQILPDTYNSIDYFHIDSSSGLILTARLLDHELIRYYSLSIRATDNGVPALSSDTTVTVTVIDGNDNPPIFSQPLYESYISELAPKGHLVTCVQASDADRSDFDKLKYSILSGNERMNFEIDEKVGALTLSSQRRQGMEPMYSLNVSVSDGVFTSTAQVLIRILGANLYSPVFNQRFYLAQVRENAPVGSSVIRIKATDEDSGLFGQVTYSFINDLGKAQFNIDIDGLITMVQVLDRESPANRDIVLTAMAMDGGGRASFCSVRVILLDENDNAPQFKALEYRASVKSNVAKGSLVTQVQAYDPDEGANGKVTYSLYSEAHIPVVDTLDIDFENGWMVTKGSFSHLKNSILSFFVKASDGGVPMKHSLVSVFIHVLPPEIPVPSFTQPQYSFTVPEDMPVGTTLGSVLLVPARTAVFSIVFGETNESNKGNVFIVDREAGVIQLNKPLDHEAISIFRFKVSATIKLAQMESVSVVDVEVKVLDLNDNKPSFETSSYDAMVMERMPAGTRVIQVRALDPDWGSNGQVTYSLATRPNSGPDWNSELFSVDSKTGWITTLKELDQETCSLYTFVVVASDLGEIVSLSSTAVVMVTIADVNDNPPKFEKDYYRGAIQESDPPGEVVALLSIRDGDSSDINRQVSLHITGGNPAGVFALGLVGGEWKIYVNRPLDREEKDQYLLNITASDGLFMTRTVVEVTVMDTNDNSPICNQTLYSTSFPEDIPLNSIILTVGATDADIGTNSEIQYSLFGIGVEDFYMDTNTGELKTAVALDREKTPRYKLIAQATDGGGRFCRSEISLTLQDVNDNPPSFSASRYAASVYENTAPKSLLTRLQANDPDEGRNRKVTYSLVDSAGGLFSIDESLGIVILERPLDRELQSSYSITVCASDQGVGVVLSSMVDLAITVLDVNDNPPVFQRRDYTATASEDVTVGTELLRVYATSEDIGVNAEIYYSIRSGNELGNFEINVLTGSISVVKPLDFEVCKDYYLTVEAWDGGTPPLGAVTTVAIKLTDVNDNAPTFNQDVYNIVVSEDAAVGQSIVQLLAEDPDSLLNGQIVHSIVSGDHGNQFAIDPTSGLMRVNKELDREMVSSYNLVVEARDSGSPPMSSTVTINIDVSDVNDNPPLFSQSNYTAAIQVDKPVGTSILQLSVTDQDSSLNGAPFEFQIISGNTENAFILDQAGVFWSNCIFGLDGTREYTIQVQAMDSGKPRLSSTSFIFICVTGDNLNRPVAFPLEIKIVTATDEFPGGVIGRIQATDRDENDILSFSYRSQHRSMFKMNRQDGRIVATGGLGEGRYLLNATVSDGRFYVTVDVTVVVEKATPEMLQNSITVRLENVAPEDFVGQHLRDFMSTLREVVGAVDVQSRDPVHLLSLQPVPGTSQLDLLLAVEAQGGGYYKAAQLARLLVVSRRRLERLLRISAILDGSCSSSECQGQPCEQMVQLDPTTPVTYSTARVSFVSPRFSRTERCTCVGEDCPPTPDLCEGLSCPGDMQCMATQGTPGPYACQCSPGQLGQCTGETSLTFTGNSYIKYRITDSGKTSEVKLGMRIRTMHSQGVLMYTRADPCTILKIEEGKLRFQVDCDNSLGISGRPVNDGMWHAVSVELMQNFTVLSLDNNYVERQRRLASVRPWPLGGDGTFFLGAKVQPLDSDQRGMAERRGPRALDGFRGCLDSMVLNGRELPLQNKRSRYAEVTGLTELKLGCVLYPDACQRGPCQNGGSCVSLPSGGFECSCTSKFTGGRCETEVTACIPNPCQNGACRSTGSSFLCGCQRGFTGLTCEEDVNECEREECENGGVCVNTVGAFYCNCTAGYEGPFCGQPVAVPPDLQAEALNLLGPVELISISVLLFVILILIALFVAVRKRVFPKRCSQSDVTLSADLATAVAAFPPRRLGPRGSFLEGGGPPQVLVRPTAYTLPRVHSGLRVDLDGVADGMGVGHMPASALHTESPYALTARRGIAVCSVAPNLPRVSPCRSVCSSTCKWVGGGQGMVDMVEEVTSFSGSNSEVQSLSSLLSDSYDDDASVVTVVPLANDAINNEVSVMDQQQSYNTAYLWNTPNWRSASRLLEINDIPRRESWGSARELETADYLVGHITDDGNPELPLPLPEGHYDTPPAARPAFVESPLTGRRIYPHFRPGSFQGRDGDQGVWAGELGTYASVSSLHELETERPPASVSPTVRLSNNSSSSAHSDSETGSSDYESVDECLAESHLALMGARRRTQV